MQFLDDESLELERSYDLALASGILSTHSVHAAISADGEPTR